MSSLAAGMSSITIFLFSSDGVSPLGTAFIVGYPVSDKAGYIPLIVTAKHVVGDAAQIVGRFSMKQGGLTGAARYDIAELRKNGDVWEHSDDGVDLLVFRTPHFEATQYQPMSLTNIASRQIYIEEEISPTDRIVFPCLLANFMGSTQNYPIIRSGSIALIPDEQVPLEYKVGDRIIKTRQQVMMIDAMSIPGASGSPIFLWPGPRAKSVAYTLAGSKSWLLGVMHGFFTSPRETTEVPVQTGTRNVFAENSGIAIVFPSWRLLEILNSEKLKQRIKILGDQPSST
jgi:hypothetical protein